MGICKTVHTIGLFTYIKFCGGGPWVKPGSLLFTKSFILILVTCIGFLASWLPGLPYHKGNPLSQSHNLN